MLAAVSNILVDLFSILVARHESIVKRNFFYTLLVALSTAIKKKISYFLRRRLLWLDGRLITAAGILCANENSQIGIVHILIFGNATFCAALTKIWRFEISLTIIGNSIRHTNARTFAVLLLRLAFLNRRLSHIFCCRSLCRRRCVARRWTRCGCIYSYINKTLRMKRKHMVIPRKY